MLRAGDFYRQIFPLIRGTEEDNQLYKGEDLPEVYVYPDLYLINQLQRAYPDREFRHKIYTALDNQIYSDKNNVEGRFYDSDVPYRRLLDAHHKAGDPHIMNARHLPIPDFIQRAANNLYDSNSKDFRDKTSQTPDHRYYRAAYESPINTIFLDYALPPNLLYDDLISEYAHPIVNRMPSYFNQQITSGLNREAYDAVEYDTPGANEYYTHKPGLTENYLRNSLLPEGIAKEAWEANRLNSMIDFDYSVFDDENIRNTAIEQSNKELNNNWNRREVKPVLNMQQLNQILHRDIQENKPNPTFKNFWREYNKWQPNGGVGGGGSW